MRQDVETIIAKKELLRQTEALSVSVLPNQLINKVLAML
jgi:hypothetical protein